ILIFTSMLSLAYSVFQGNVGTAYRQRAQLLVFYFIFVAVGFVLLKERREDKARRAEAERRALLQPPQPRWSVERTPQPATESSEQRMASGLQSNSLNEVMCEIAGIVGNDRAMIDRDLLVRMAEAIRDRGPDEDGFYFGDGAGLGMRRLAIIDLKSGQQPIANQDRTAWIVFN